MENLVKKVKKYMTNKKEQKKEAELQVMCDKAYRAAKDYIRPAMQKEWEKRKDDILLDFEKTKQSDLIEEFCLISEAIVSDDKNKQLICAKKAGEIAKFNGRWYGEKNMADNHYGYYYPARDILLFSGKAKAIYSIAYQVNEDAEQVTMMEDTTLDRMAANHNYEAALTDFLEASGSAIELRKLHDDILKLVEDIRESDKASKSQEQTARMN